MFTRVSSTKLLNEKAGAGQQHDRQRHLGDDERCTQTCERPPRGAAVAALAQALGRRARVDCSAGKIPKARLVGSAVRRA